jgi:peptidoglycan/LPS O-acetylase OafA/YrhL
MNPLHTTAWIIPLLEFLMVLAILYGVPALVLAFVARRTEAGLELAASPRVQTPFQPYMEGLRGLMAVNVFMVHGSALHAFLHGGDFFPVSDFHRQIGVSAVCLFFFMTGYLLWKGIIDRPQFSRTRYLRGRFLRTWPLYAVAITLVFVFALAQTGFHILVPLPKFIISYIAWLAFALPMGAGNAINGNHDITSLGAGVFWTLQMDWVYYLILPFLIWFTRRSWRLLLILIPAAVIYKVLHLHPYHGALARISVFSTFFFWCFCFGMIAAVIKAQWPEWRWARTRSASAVALVIYVVTLCFIPPAWGRYESLLLFPLFMLIAYGTDFFGLLNTAVAIFMGRISYSIYLLHALVLFSFIWAFGSRMHLAQLSWLGFWLAIAPLGLLAIGISTLTHRWIEVPFNALGRPRPAAASIPTPGDATLAQIRVALQEEASELPGMAEAELLLPTNPGSKPDRRIP